MNDLSIDELVKQRSGIQCSMTDCDVVNDLKIEEIIVYLHFINSYYIIEVFDYAVNTFPLSVELWLAYIRFMRTELMKRKDGLEGIQRYTNERNEVRKIEREGWNEYDWRKKEGNCCELRVRMTLKGGGYSNPHFGIGKKENSLVRERMKKREKNTSIWNPNGIWMDGFPSFFFVELCKKSNWLW